MAEAAFKSAPDPSVPVLDIDPFDPAFLADPYPVHAHMRAAGPLFWIPKYAIWASARHAEVQSALKDHAAFCSGRGVGLADFAKEKPWRPPSLLLERDPPLHTRTRGVLSRILNAAALAEMRGQFEAAAETLADELRARGETFDAVKDVAEVFPVRIFADIIGLQREGRENLLPYAALAFNAFGPRNRLLEDALARAAGAQAWVMAQCRRGQLAPGSLGAKVFEAVDRGEASEEEGALLVRSFLTAGIDTTVNGIGNALYAFAVNAHQWPLLHADPARARAACEEALRYESPVQTFFRTTARPVEFAGARLGEGEKILLFLGAANRDPRRWEDPDRFDIARQAAGHLAFGIGIHGCVGQMVARLEIELVLAAFAKRARTLAPAGAPARALNNTLRGVSSAPVRVQWA